MRWLGVVAVSVMLGLSAPAGAEVVIAISKSQQSMTVSINGAPTYHWTVSTGRPGYDTPNGRFTPQRLARVYYSKKFDDAPMPNSVFFYGGYAIHGTYEEAKLGSPVSHGCVRLTRANAATLFALVGAQGLRNTHVVITDGAGREPPMASERRPVLQVADRDGPPRAGDDREFDRREFRYDPRDNPRSGPRYSPRRDLREEPRSRRELRADPRDERRYRPRPTRYDPRDDRRYRPRPVRDEPRYEPRSSHDHLRDEPRRPSRYALRYEARREPPPRGRFELLREYERNARRQAVIERELGGPPPRERPRTRDRYSDADGFRW